MVSLQPTLAVRKLEIHKQKMKYTWKFFTVVTAKQHYLHCVKIYLNTTYNR